MKTTIKLRCGVTLIFTRLIDGSTHIHSDNAAVINPEGQQENTQFFADLYRVGIITRDEAQKIVQALTGPIQ